MRTNGTTRDSLVLIGSELAMADSSTDISEFEGRTKEWLETFFGTNSMEGLVLLNVHEYVHTQQNPIPDNLLHIALYEGVAEFVSVKAMGVPSNVLVTERYIMLFGKVQAHMMLGQNKEALRLINAFLNSPSADDKQDAFIFIRFLFLFVYQELGDTDTVENGIRSLELYLKQQGRIFQFEEKTLKLLTELCQTNDQRIVSERWKKYQITLLELKKDPFERDATLNFDLVDWLEFKLSSKIN